MALQRNGPELTFVASGALDAYRRVKLHAADPTMVEYAGAGEAGPYVTQEKVADGDTVTVRKLIGCGTCRVSAAGAFANGATLYPAAAGQVDDAVVGDPIGTALSASTAPNDLVEMDSNTGIAGTINGEMIENFNNADGGMPIMFSVVATPDAVPNDVVVFTAPRALKIIDAWMVSRDTTAADVTLKNGATNEITGAVAKGTAADVIVRFDKLVAAYATLAKNDVVKAEFSAQADVDVFVMCLPIA